VVLVGVTGLLMAAVPAAHAGGDGPIPFNVDVPIGPVGPITIDAVPDVDTGLVGVCDPQFQCTGFRATASASAISGGTTPGRVTLRGYVCVVDSSAACGNGIPFTGVKITERVVDTPEPYVGPIYVSVNVCVWLMSPMDDPHACDLPVINADETRAPDSGNLADLLPA
ncbi:MAG: hypothetical protein M3217_05205, partial [Actinomycetota bacterium]|nr:hypothetical protein [Actinomycetota bacterium]